MLLLVAIVSQCLSQVQMTAVTPTVFKEVLHGIAVKSVKNELAGVVACCKGFV